MSLQILSRDLLSAKVIGLSFAYMLKVPRLVNYFFLNALGIGAAGEHQFHKFIFLPWEGWEQPQKDKTTKQMYCK